MNRKTKININYLKEKYENLILRKELAINDYNNLEGKQESLVDNKENIFLVKPWQKILANFFHPLTKNNRILINAGTGSGKTISSIILLKQQLELSSKKVGSNIIVLGFTANNFKSDIIKFKDIKILPKKVVDELNKLKSETEINRYVNLFFKQLKEKKIYENAGVMFYGFKLLYQRLFIFNNKNIVINTFSDLMREISNSNITVAEDVLRSFDNSLIICDEIHNLYNEEESNTWGMAIIYLLKKIPSIKAVFLSATPISKSKREVVHLLNLLNDKDNIISFDDIFDNEENLLPKGEELITEVSKGKIIYYRNNEKKSFPSSEFIGQEVEGIEGLKMRLCDINDTYASILKTGEVNPDELNNMVLYESDNKGFSNDMYVEVNNSAYTTVDAVKDLPDNDVIEYRKIKFNQQSQERFSLIIKDDFDDEKFAPKYYACMMDLIKTLKAKKGGKTIIYHNKVVNTGVHLVKQLLKKYGFLFRGDTPDTRTICKNCGDIKLNHSEKALSINVSDFSKQELDDTITQKRARMIYSNKKLDIDIPITNIEDIEINGVITNKFIYIIDDSDKYCIFEPAVFVTLTGLDDAVTILSEYNSPANKFGDNILILVGSVYIKESIDFNCVRYLKVLSRPYDISSLIQVRGRAIRNKSHIMLPESKQNVKIYLYVNNYSGNNMDIDHKYTPELDNYRIRMESFNSFKYIERLLYKNAINNFTFDEESTTDFDQIVLPKKKYEGIDDSLYNMIYGTDELKEIKRVIKNIFLHISFIEYNDLINKIKNFHNEYNWYLRTDLFDDDIINVALYELLYDENSNYIMIDNGLASSEYTSVISENKLIYKNGNNHYIVSVTINGKIYFQLTDVSDVNIIKQNIIKQYTDNLVDNKIRLKLVEKTIDKDPDGIFKLYEKNTDKYNIYENLTNKEKASVLKYMVDMGLFEKDGKIEKYLVYMCYIVAVAMFFGNLVIQIDILPTDKKYKIMINYINGFINNKSEISMFGDTKKKVPKRLEFLVDELIKITSETKNMSFFKFSQISIDDKIYYKSYDDDTYADENNWIEKTIKHDIIENDIVVGYYMFDKHGNKKFKLREPIHRSEEKPDARKKKVGIYYKFERKDVLIDYIIKLEKIEDQERIKELNKKSIEELGNYILVLLKTMDKNSKDGVRYFIFEYVEEE
jgi:superfamily II DNA or RNA helicase